MKQVFSSLVAIALLLAPAFASETFLIPFELIDEATLGDGLRKRPAGYSRGAQCLQSSYQVGRDTMTIPQPVARWVVSLRETDSGEWVLSRSVEMIVEESILKKTVMTSYAGKLRLEEPESFKETCGIGALTGFQAGVKFVVLESFRMVEGSLTPKSEEQVFFGDLQGTHMDTVVAELRSRLSTLKQVGSGMGQVPHLVNLDLARANGAGFESYLSEFQKQKIIFYQYYLVTPWSEIP